MTREKPLNLPLDNNQLFDNLLDHTIILYLRLQADVRGGEPVLTPSIRFVQRSVLRRLVFKAGLNGMIEAYIFFLQMMKIVQIINE